MGRKTIPEKTEILDISKTYVTPETIVTKLPDQKQPLTENTAPWRKILVDKKQIDLDKKSAEKDNTKISKEIDTSSTEAEKKKKKKKKNSSKEAKKKKKKKKKKK